MVRQIGILAIVCAKRKNVLMQIFKGKVFVYFGTGPDRKVLSADWNDDEKINDIIRELNQGKYREEVS